MKPDDQQNAGVDELPTISNLASSGRIDSGEAAAETDNGAGVTSAGGESGLPHHTIPSEEWMPEILSMVRERLAAYLGEDHMQGCPPMFYDDAITSVAYRFAVGKAPEELYPDGSLLHRLREAEAEVSRLRALAGDGARYRFLRRDPDVLRRINDAAIGTDSFDRMVDAAMGNRCEACADAGFPPHGLDLPAEFGPRPCESSRATLTPERER